MEEIAQQFRKELQELLDRYKDRLTTPQIMSIAQPVFTKTIGFKDNPERFIAHPSITGKWSSEQHTLQEINGVKVPVDLIEYVKSHDLAKEHLEQILSSGPSFLEQHALKGEFKWVD